MNKQKEQNQSEKKTKKMTKRRKLLMLKGINEYQVQES